MLNFTGGLKIFVALDACDMRAGAGTLTEIVAEKLRENVRDEALFVFTNKRRTVLKILYWDGTGTWAGRCGRGMSGPENQVCGENQIDVVHGAVVRMRP
jgi:transposase